MDLDTWVKVGASAIPIAVSALPVIISVLALFLSWRANRISKASRAISEEANQLSTEANRIAEETKANDLENPDFEWEISVTDDNRIRAENKGKDKAYDVSFRFELIGLIEFEHSVKDVKPYEGNCIFDLDTELQIGQTEPMNFLISFKKDFLAHYNLNEEELKRIKKEKAEQERRARNEPLGMALQSPFNFPIFSPLANIQGLNGSLINGEISVSGKLSYKQLEGSQRLHHEEIVSRFYKC